MEKSFSFKKNILVVLPHLDDEFAFAPILKKLSKNPNYNIFLIFCAEKVKFGDNRTQQLVRRKESIKSINFLGLKSDNVLYLNDHFTVNDLHLASCWKQVYNFLNEFINEKKIDQLMTTSFEGGHPDHDTLALIVNKFELSKLFIPIYNSRKSLFAIPFSVMRPLKSQESMFYYFKVGYFSWLDSLIIAFIYLSEFKAMVKLIPFIIYKCLFSNKVYFTNKICLTNINFEETLTYKSYKTDLSTIIKKIL